MVPTFIEQAQSDLEGFKQAVQRLEEAIRYEDINCADEVYAAAKRFLVDAKRLAEDTSAFLERQREDEIDDRADNDDN